MTGVRRVRRSRKDRVFGGVCGGLGRYLNVDPVPLRIAAVALVVGTSLVALGALLLVQQVVPWFSSAILWPVVIVAIGVAVVFSARR